MAFEKSVLVDSNIFTFSVVKEGLLNITERSRKVRKIVIIGKAMARWLVVAFVELGDSHFYKSCKGNRAFLAHQCVKYYEHCLVIIEYCYGGKKGFIIILEGKDGKGRRCFTEKLKVLGHANSSVSITNDRGSFDYGVKV